MILFSINFVVGLEVHCHAKIIDVFEKNLLGHPVLDAPENPSEGGVAVGMGFVLSCSHVLPGAYGVHSAFNDLSVELLAKLLWLREITDSARVSKQKKTTGLETREWKDTHFRKSPWRRIVDELV